MALVAVPNELDTERLGALVWYTVKNAAMGTRTEIQTALALAGLPDSLTPKPIPASDALRRAIKDLGTLPEEKTNQGQVVRLLIREVPPADKDHLAYHLVRETGDASREHLDYREIGTIELHKRTSSLLVSPIASASVSQHELSVLEQVTARYQFDREHYDSEMVRYIARMALKNSDPISVRPSGGVYFIARDYLGRVKQVGVFLEQFASGTRLYSVPVVDDADMRSMVSDSVEEQVDTEATRVVTELRTLLERGTPTEIQAVAAVRSIRELAAMTERYEELLETRIEGARAALEAAQAQARTLLEAMTQ